MIDNFHIAYNYLNKNNLPSNANNPSILFIPLIMGNGDVCNENLLKILG